jgi:autotransporter-associated beta strand protein
MNAKKLLRFVGTIVAMGIMLSVLFAAQKAQAQVLTWTGSAGAAWSTSSTNWSTVGVGTPWDSTNGPSYVADFNTASATPSVSGNLVNANGIQFDNTATVSGGTINLVTAGGSTFSTPTITMNAAATIGSILTGSAGVIKTGTGTLTLSAANVFTGGLTINAGRVVAANASAFGASTGTLTLSGGSITTSGVLTISNPIYVAPGTITDVYGTSGGSNYPKFTGALTGSGTFSNNNTAAGGLGNSFVNGDISQFTGTFNFVNVSGASNNFQFNGGGGNNANGSQAHFVSNGLTSGGTATARGQWIVFETANTTFQMGDLSGSGGIIDSVGAGTLQIGALNTSTTFGGVINNLSGAISLTKVGSGSLTLAGANGYTGTTMVSGGALVAGANAPSGASGAFGNSSGALVLGSTYTTTNNSSPQLLTGGAFTIGLPITIANQATTGTYTIGGNTDNNATFGGLITISQPLIVSQVANAGGNVLSITGGITSGLSGTQTVTFAGPGNVNVSTVGIGDGTGTLAVSVTGGIVNFNAANTYTGPTSLNGGALYLNAANSTTSISVGGGAKLGGIGSAPSAAANVANGGVLDFSQNTGSTFSLASLTYAGSSTLNIGGLSNYTSSPALSAGALTTSGAIDIYANLGSVSVVTGTYDLVSYSSIAGAGSSAFTLMSVAGLANRQTAKLVDISNQIEVAVNGPTPYWNGTSADWKATNAWTLQPGGSKTTFQTGDSDVFDDTAIGSANGGNVVLNTGDVAPATVLFNNNALAYSLSGNFGITGNASLTVAGGGYVAITNTNSYTGGTVLSNGTLSFGNGALGSTENITFAGSNADLQWNGSNTQDVSGRLVINNAATATIDTQGNNVTFASGFGGGLSGSLVYVGSGVLTLIGTNTYVGSTTVSNGTLQLGDGTVGHDGSIASTSGVTDNATLTYNLAGNQTASYVINGTGALTKSGSGTLTLAGANGYGGTTTINGGILSIGSASYLPSASALTIANSAALKMTAAMTLANSVTIASGQTGTLTAASGQVYLTGDYSGVAGTLNLDMRTNLGNYYGFIVNSASGPGAGSTVQLIDNASPIGQVQLNSTAYQSFFANANVVFSTTGGFALQGGNGGSGVNVQFGALNGGSSLTDIQFDNHTGCSVTINGITGGNFAGYIENGGGSSGPVSLLMTGTASQTLSGGNTYTGATTINGGVLQIGAGGNTGSLSPSTIITDNATLAVSRSDNVAQSVIVSNSPIGGVGGLTQIGPGTLTLDQLNTYSGPTVINGSVLNAVSLANEGTASAIGEGSGSVSPADLVINGGTLQYTGAVAASTNFLFTIGASGSAALDASGNVFGAMTVGSAGGSLAFANTAAAATITLTGSGAGFLGAEIDDSNPGVHATSLVKLGAGTWVLTGPNTYTGSTTVGAGALFINGSNATGGISVAGGATLGGSGTAAGIATVAAGGSIQAGYNGAGSLTLGGLSMGTGNIGIANIANYVSAAAVVVTGNNGLTVSGGSHSVTIVLSGPTPTGTGSVELLQYSGAIQGGNSTDFTLNTAGLQNLSSRALFTLSNPSGYIDLNYSVNYPVWSGLGNGIWDTVTQSPKNWALASNGSPTDFIAGDAVVFDDSAGTNTIVSISGTGNVYPSSVTFNNLNQNYLIQGTHAIAGSATLAVDGGYVAITNTNSYTGGTTLTNGTLSFANGALGSTGNITFAGSNADLQWNGSNTQDVSGRLVINTGATATIDTQGNNVTFASGIGGIGGSLVYVGSGTLTLTATNTYAGSTTISNGTLQLGDGTPGHDGSIAATSGVTNNAVLTYNLAGNQTASYGIGGTGAVTKSGSGTLVLSGSNGYSGATTVNGGVLSIAAATNLQSGSPLTLVNGGAVNVTANMTLANNVTVAVGQAGTIKATGAVGNPQLSGAYSGTAGTLTLDETGVASNYGGFNIQSASGPALGSVVLVLGATGANNVQIVNNNSAFQAFFANAKVSFVATGAGNTYLACGNSSATNLQVGALDGGNATTLIGFDNRSGSTVTINGVANGNFAGSIIDGLGGSSGINLVMSGTATQVLSGQNTFTGSTSINGGVLKVGSPENPGTSGPLGNGGMISFGGGTLQYSASNQYDYSSRFSTVDGQLYSVDTNGQNVTWAGDLASINGSSLTKLGSGALILSGTNTYDSGTTVLGGTLIVANAEAIAAGSSLTVGAGASSLFAPALAGPADHAYMVPAAVPASVAAVPEPGTLLLFAAALASTAVYRRMRRLYSSRSA